ncbi:MAG: hypothetical protein ACYCO0_05045 [Candidatus Micrarchaeaceae archaeon]
MEYLNNLYTSKNWEDIVEFYEHFNSKEEIIQWMKNRKRAKYSIKNYNFSENNKKIIVVMTTKDRNGPLANNCKQIYKELPMIFVEGGKEYFNFSQATNQGIAEAMKYNPQWVIISNDDILEIDKMSHLISELSHIKTDLYQPDTIFFYKTKLYNGDAGESKMRFYKVFAQLSSWRRNYLKVYKKFKVNYVTLQHDKHSIFYNKLMYKKVRCLPKYQDSLIILSAQFINSVNKKPFDEGFINGCEDLYLFYLLSKRNNYRFSNFRINSNSGESLGRGVDRAFRTIANQIYLEKLIK